MRRTKSEPIQFRLPLDDYAVLERLATAAALSPKDYVIQLTTARIEAERQATATTA